MPPRLAEVAPGEVRTLCHGCGRVIAPRASYCEECKPTRGRHCTRCGSPSSVEVCRKCRAGRPQNLSEDKREAVEQMWAEKIRAKEIAQRLGIRTKDPGAMISRARRRGWDLPYRRPDNVKYGKKLARKVGRDGAATRMRRLPGIAEIRGKGPYSDAARAAVERMWAEEFTAREIAENMGWSLSNPGANITKARNRGWNLPYRNPSVVEDSREKMRAVNA